MTLFSRGFWAATAERAIKTFAQTLGAYFVIGTTGLLDLDWATAASVSGAAALASVLTSVGSAAASGGTPSLGPEVPAPVAQQAVNEAVANVYMNRREYREQHGTD